MADEFPRRLASESSGWVKEGLLSTEQRDAILSRHPVGGEDSSQHQKLTATVATMGAVLIGIGVILFFASNWQKISPFQKMAILLTALISCHWVGYRLETRPDAFPRMSRAFNLLGCVLYGSNIFLLAQAYNINSHWPTGVLWWGLGTLPMALLLSSKAMSSLALGALTFWMGSELSVSRRGGDDGLAMIVMFLVWGCAAMGLGRLMSRDERLERPGQAFQWLGLLLVLWSVFVTTFSDSSPRAVVWSDAKDWFEWKAFVACTGFVSVLSVALLAAKRRSHLDSGIAVWLGAALTWALCLACLLPIGATPTAVAGNVVLLSAIVALLFMGYLHSVPSFINLGLLAFAALVIARYFDMVWKYMDRAAGFVLGGLLLLLLGFTMERGRRALMRGPGAA